MLTASDTDRNFRLTILDHVMILLFLAVAVPKPYDVIANCFQVRESEAFVTAWIEAN